MRFNARFSDVTRETIVNILIGLSRLSDLSVCAIVLTDLKSLELRAVTDTSSAFGKVDFSQFSTFRVTSKANNVIAAEVQISALLSAFKSADNAEEVSLKLTKNRNQQICFTLVARTLTQISVTQDILVVNMLPVNEMSRYQEPSPNRLDAAVAFPDAKAAKTVLERMKHLDKFVQIKADQKHGTLVFRIDNEVVSTRNVFDGLAIEIEDTEAEILSQRHAYVQAQVSSKEFASIVFAVANFGKRVSMTTLAIARGVVLCLHVTYDDGSRLTFYLATSSSDDDDIPYVENTQILRLETLRNEDDDGDL